MRQSDTPETDVEIWTDEFGGECINTDFARDLERQRDAAREDAERLAEALECFMDVGLCKAFRDMTDKALVAHEAITKIKPQD